MTLRFLVRERPNIKSIEFEGNDEIDNDKLTEAHRGQAEHDPELRRRPPQRAEDQGHVRREGLLPRRRLTSEVVPQKDNEVDRQVHDHGARAGHRPAHHVHRQRPRPRRRAPRVMQTGTRRLLLVRLRRPVPPGRLRARRPRAQRPLLRQGLPHGADRDAARDAHARSRAASRSRSSSTRARASRSASSRSTSATTDGNEIEPLGGRRALREMVRAKAGDYFNRAELRRRTSARSARSTATPATPTSRPTRDGARPREARGRHRRPDPARTAGLLRAHRDQGQHQDARQGHPPRDGDRRRASSSARRSSNSPSAASPRSATSSASTSRPSRASTPEHDQRQLRGRRAADRHVPGRRRLLQHRELHRHGADPAGQPVRQRPVARAAGADLRPAAARQRPLLRAVLPRHRLFGLSIELYDQLRVFADFSQTIASAARSPSATRSIEPELRASRRPTRLEHDKVSTVDRVDVLRHGSGASRVFQRLPLANLFNDGLTSQLRPALTYDTRDNRLFPTSGIFLQALDRARRRAYSARTNRVPPPPRSRAASTTRSAPRLSSSS